MARWRGNLQAPFTRLPFMHKRRVKPAEADWAPPVERGSEGQAIRLSLFSTWLSGSALLVLQLKCRACAFGPFLLDLGFPGNRHDTQRRDTVAFAAQHPEAEAVKGEALAAFGNRAGFVNY